MSRGRWASPGDHPLNLAGTENGRQPSERGYSLGSRGEPARGGEGGDLGPWANALNGPWLAVPGLGGFSSCDQCSPARLTMKDVPSVKKKCQCQRELSGRALTLKEQGLVVHQGLISSAIYVHAASHRIRIECCSPIRRQIRCLSHPSYLINLRQNQFTTFTCLGLIGLGTLF